MTKSRKIAVVGAGWAGCAAAVELAAAGHKITLFESSRTLGGRARAVDINGLPLDNGQHILLGAYSETLRLLAKVGVDTNQALLRLPLQMRYPKNGGGMDFIAARLPAPLHLLIALLRVTGLTFADKIALARFFTTARWMDWRLHVDCSVTELLDRFDQTSRLIQLLWRPLCIAALNTPPSRASAQVFLNVLRDSLGARRTASDMLIPRVDLTALFPRQAAGFVDEHGGQTRAGITVQKITANEGHWSVASDDTGAAEIFDAVVVATQATQAATLLQDFIGDRPLPAFEYEPITTCYLQYAQDTGLPAPFLALIDEPENARWGQFVFDRGQLDARQAGLLSVVVSASTEAISGGHDALSITIAQQLAHDLHMPHLAHPLWTKVISEKRATFSCTPGLPRPIEQTAFPNLVIAGDYMAGDYPATLESAVRSGVKAARLLRENFKST